MPYNIKCLIDIQETQNETFAENDYKCPLKVVSLRWRDFHLDEILKSTVKSEIKIETERFRSL